MPFLSLCIFGCCRSFSLKEKNAHKRLKLLDSLLYDSKWTLLIQEAAAVLAPWSHWPEAVSLPSLSVWQAFAEVWTCANMCWTTEKQRIKDRPPSWAQCLMGCIWMSVWPVCLLVLLRTVYFLRLFPSGYVWSQQTIFETPSVFGNLFATLLSIF